MDSIFGPGQSATGKHLLVEQVGQRGADHLSSAKSHHVVGVDSGKGIREGPPDRPRRVGEGSGGGKPVAAADISGHSSRDFSLVDKRITKRSPKVAKISLTKILVPDLVFSEKSTGSIPNK